MSLHKLSTRSTDDLRNISRSRYRNIPMIKLVNCFSFSKVSLHLVPWGILKRKILWGFIYIGEYEKSLIWFGQFQRLTYNLQHPTCYLEYRLTQLGLGCCVNNYKIGLLDQFFSTQSCVKAKIDLRLLVIVDSAFFLNTSHIMVK